MEDRPIGRKKNVGTGGSGVHKRGDGLGGGPVGSSNGVPGGSSSGSGSGRNRSGGGPLFMIVVIVILLMAGGGSLTSALLGGSDSEEMTSGSANNNFQTTTQQTESTPTSDSSNSSDGSFLSILDSLFGDTESYSGGSMTSAQWSDTPNTGSLDTTVASEARAKRTTIKGDGKDTITIMVYMCGADLESNGGMASKDIQEMLSAKFDDRINLIIYTGGAKKWQNNVISNSTNQIYQIKDGKLLCLKDNIGNLTMTKSDTLSDFIRWSADKFPADRYDLIFWNHGGGSTGGYGYDEKHPSDGSMSLAGINTALKDGGVTFDFVGFDTCLMATVENALVVSKYADYMVASEEIEPGVGWYYTKWLTDLGSNTSMDTIEIGQKIIDTYTEECARSCYGQKTTLSLIDLAELSQTVPSDLAAFSRGTVGMINGSNYITVSNARSSTREFASSSKIDQVDLVDFAYKVGTSEAKELANTLRSAVKYNRTSANMTNAYGLSIYFPYKKASKVDSMVGTYEAIGMDEDYKNCIQSFASMEVAGQVASGGTSSPAASLFDIAGSAGSSSGAMDSAELIAELLNAFLSSDRSSVSGLSAANTQFLNASLDVTKASEYISSYQFDPSALEWTTNEEDYTCISLTEEQWKLIQDVKINMFYDDGEGYVNLGLDNTLEFDEQGNLLAPDDRTWLAIDGQIVFFEIVDVQGDSDSYAITGRVPCELNGERCNLIIVFDSDNEDGYVAGACYDYVEGQTDTIAKNLTQLEEGDTIDYICDYYNYNKTFQQNYYIADQVVVDKPMSEMRINNLPVGNGNLLVTFKFTDIYGQEYWTPTLE